MKVIYIGTDRVKIKFTDGSDKKISNGEIIDVSELDWARFSPSGNFELFTERIETEKIEKISSKKTVKKLHGGNSYG